MAPSGDRTVTERVGAAIAARDDELRAWAKWTPTGGATRPSATTPTARPVPLISPTTLDRVRQERRLRAVADAQGLRVQMSTRQGDRGTFQVVDATYGSVVLGDKRHGFGMTLEEVEAFLASCR